MNFEKVDFLLSYLCARKGFSTCKHGRIKRCQIWPLVQRSSPTSPSRSSDEDMLRRSAGDFLCKLFTTEDRSRSSIRKRAGVIQLSGRCNHRRSHHVLDCDLFVKMSMRIVECIFMIFHRNLRKLLLLCSVSSHVSSCNRRIQPRERSTTSPFKDIVGAK